MYIYNTQDLLDRRDTLRVSLHAMLEVYKEGLRGRDILNAIFCGRIIERYPDRDRVLILGPTVRERFPLHVVCDYADADEIVAVTAYIPDRAEWVVPGVKKRFRNAV